MSTKTVTYVDLFAGIGGFAAAFEGMGFQNLVAAEFDKDAATTYKKFWGHEALRDVTEIAPDFDESEMVGIPRHAILSAGFPCQPFSKSGAQLGVLDASRGTLFHNIINAIRTGQPKLVILENVRNLAGPKHAKDLEVIKASLRELGYRVSSQNSFVSPHKLSPDFGGRPQNRERIFIVATKVENGDLSDLDAEPLDIYGISSEIWSPKQWDLDRDLLREKDNGNLSLRISEDEEYVLEAWDEFVQLIRSIPVQVPAFPIWSDSWGAYANLDGLPTWKIQILQKNQAFYLSNKKLLDGWLEKHEVRTKTLFTPSKRKFEWQAQNMQSLFEGVVHFRPSGVRVKAANYLPALVAITQTPILAKYRRRLSVTEAARLQGFPDHFLFDHQSDSKTFRQLGNGVNVGVVWSVLKATVIRDRDILEKTIEGREIVKLVESAPMSPDSALNLLQMANNKI